MTVGTQELNEILAKHNGELGVTWEDPDVVTPDTKQAILQWVNDEVIGKDESTTRAGNSAQFNSISGQNLLRKKQRNLLETHGHKGEEKV